MFYQILSKIWIVVIIAVLIAGGILTWQYFLVPKEKITQPEKIEITQPEKKEDQPVETLPQPEKPITLLIEKTEFGEKIAVIENGKKDSWFETSWMISPDEKKIIWKGRVFEEEGLFSPTQLFVAEIVEKLNKDKLKFLIREKKLLLKVPDERFNEMDRGVFMQLHQWSRDGMHFYLKLHGENLGGILTAYYIKINVKSGEITKIIDSGHILDISPDEKKFAFFVWPSNSLIIKELDGTDKVFSIGKETHIMFEGYFSPNEKYFAGLLEAFYPDDPQDTRFYSEIVIFDLERGTMNTIVRYPIDEYKLEGWLTNEKLKLSKAGIIYSINRDGSGLIPLNSDE